MRRIFIELLLIMHGNNTNQQKNRRDPSESQEQVAHKVAWAAVEKKYRKGSNGNWEAI